MYRIKYLHKLINAICIEVYEGLALPHNEILNYLTLKHVEYVNIINSEGWKNIKITLTTIYMLIRVYFKNRN